MRGECYRVFGGVVDGRFEVDELGVLGVEGVFLACRGEAVGGERLCLGGVHEATQRHRDLRHQVFLVNDGLDVNHCHKRSSW